MVHQDTRQGLAAVEVAGFGCDCHLSTGTILSTRAQLPFGTENQTFIESGLIYDQPSATQVVGIVTGIGCAI